VLRPAGAVRPALAQGHTTTSFFLSNYAYVHLNDPMTARPGVGQVLVFGATSTPSILGQSRHPGQARHHRE